jgi:hypothetical protein
MAEQQLSLLEPKLEPKTVAPRAATLPAPNDEPHLRN